MDNCGDVDRGCFRLHDGNPLGRPALGLTGYSEAPKGGAALYWLVTFSLFFLGTPVVLVWCFVEAVRQRRADQLLAAQVRIHERDHEFLDGDSED